MFRSDLGNHISISLSPADKKHQHVEKGAIGLQQQRKTKFLVLVEICYSTKLSRHL